MFRPNFDPKNPTFPLQFFDEVVAVIRDLTQTGQVTWTVTQGLNSSRQCLRSTTRECTDGCDDWAGCPLNVIAKRFGLKDWSDVCGPQDEFCVAEKVYGGADELTGHHHERERLMDAVGLTVK